MMPLVVAIACMSAAGCSSDEGSASLGDTKGASVEVSETTWRDGEWPFTRAARNIGCTDPGEVTFNAEGTLYGVNGTALDQGLPAIDLIWRSAGGGLKVDIGGVIDRGLKLCEESE
jgi:hypothetical protein